MLVSHASQVSIIQILIMNMTWNLKLTAKCVKPKFKQNQGPPKETWMILWQSSKTTEKRTQKRSTPTLWPTTSQTRILEARVPSVTERRQFMLTLKMNTRIFYQNKCSRTNKSSRHYLRMQSSKLRINSITVAGRLMVSTLDLKSRTNHFKKNLNLI